MGIFGFTRKKRPGEEGMNRAVNNAATIWDEATGQQRMMLLGSIGMHPGHPLFTDTMISKYARLDEKVQISLLGVIEGIRLGVLG